MPAIPNNLWDHLRSFGDAPAMITEQGIFSWDELLNAALQDAAVLHDHGLRPDAFCAFRGSPAAETVHCLLALWMLGATPAPLNTHLPLNAALKQLRQIGCRFFINLNSEHIATQGITAIPADLRQKAGDSQAEFRQFDANRPATILFTSGSSASPKACIHTFSQHLHSAVGANLNMPLEAGDRWLLSLPLYHVAGIGILFRVMCAGAAVTLVPSHGSLEKTLVCQEITHLSLVATQLYRLLDDRNAINRLHHLKAILLGGSAIPESLIRRSYELQLPIFLSYGLTETASQVVATLPNDDLEQLLAGGRLLPFRELKIMNNEILVRGETLFRGYLQSEGLLKLFDADGWFATGDLGAMDGDGRLRVIGRRDNMFISGGENIYPEEIERALLRLPDVKEAVVVPLKDVEFGHRPAAFLRTISGISAAEVDLSPLRADLPGYKIPARLFDWPKEENNLGIKTDRQFFKKLLLKIVNQKRGSVR